MQADVTPSEARQAYLEQAVREMRLMFVYQGKPLTDKLRVSVAPPQKRWLGVCYHYASSADLHREIFIAGNLDDTKEVLGTLLHELCHAALPDSVAHGKPWLRLSRAVGLEGKGAHTVNGPRVVAWIEGFMLRHGKYPAERLLGGKIQGKQSTAMLKVECLDCGYIVRTTAKWLAHGSPICPCNNEPMECV